MNVCVCAPPTLRAGYFPAYHFPYLSYPLFFVDSLCSQLRNIGLLCVLGFSKLPPVSEPSLTLKCFLFPSSIHFKLDPSDLVQQCKYDRVRCSVKQSQLILIQRFCVSATLQVSTFAYNHSYLFIYSFQDHTHDIWKFPGQGLNGSCSCWPTPQLQQSRIRAASAAYTTAHGKARSI